MKTSATSSEIAATIRREAPATLEIVARSIGYFVLTEYLTSEIGHGFTVVTAPIRRDEVPSKEELSEGVALLFAYLSLPGEARLTPGFYIVRVATSGYYFKDGTATVSFLNLAGETVHRFRATATAFSEGEIQELPGFDELVSPSRQLFGKVCGKHKCFVWQREGFLKWKFGCTNKETGTVVPCVG